MAASILCLFFHDCFVNGCDSMTRRRSPAKRMPCRTRTRLEAACNQTVSCADILALAAHEGVVHHGERERGEQRPPQPSQGSASPSSSPCSPPMG
ncbi:Peroxidase 36 [Apostasia shenzhenica]|uniref:Peroxidase 36 n=1 Tax=Apostasia shenzhenica TaxID=1088818 RepID=A0A2I0A7Y4_9ASPA|nr:Peroxidase 36 [Apostasia shenzhenica]